MPIRASFRGGRRRGSRGADHRRRRLGHDRLEVRPVWYVAGGVVLAAILLHSTVDFNLYIPANVMDLMWIAGMTAALDAGAVRHPANICKTTKTIEVRVIS